MNSYKTPYDDKPYQPPKKTNKRYATAGIVLAGALVGGSLLSAGGSSRNYGKPFTFSGQKYYIPGDSKRAVYPSQQACFADVPFDRHYECEPMSSYTSGGLGRWYGPVYSKRDSYQPSSQYVTETANSNNVGKKLPKNTSPYGFGADGKKFTGSTGG